MLLVGVPILLLFCFELTIIFGLSCDIEDVLGINVLTYNFWTDQDLDQATLILSFEFAKNWVPWEVANFFIFKLPVLDKELSLELVIEGGL